MGLLVEPLPILRHAQNAEPTATQQFLTFWAFQSKTEHPNSYAPTLRAYATRPVLGTHASRRREEQHLSDPWTDWSLFQGVAFYRHGSKTVGLAV